MRLFVALPRFLSLSLFLHHCTTALGESTKTAAFIFPLMAGDVNPSLPVARSLSQRGHVVHYLCHEAFRDAITHTGASFTSVVAQCPELYETRQPCPFGAMSALAQEHGLDGDGEYARRVKLSHVQLELQLPGVLRWIKEVKPDVIVYDPIINREAAIAGVIAGVPAVALLTFAGPGAWDATVHLKVYENEHSTFDELDAAAHSFAPNVEAVERLNTKYGLSLEPWFSRGQIYPEPKTMMVTTTKELSHSERKEIVEAETNCSIHYLGPLLDVADAPRASGFKLKEAGRKSGGNDSSKEPSSQGNDGHDVMAKVGAAASTGRQIILASMGTVTTGDHPTLGWSGRPKDESGNHYGLTGAQLCRAVWGAMFDAFGTKDAEGGPLLVIVLGPQPNALGELVPPPNAVVARSVPQVDVLKAGNVAFLTHGGQNSFMEALAKAVPLLVCPTAGDQFDNARKAKELGVGLWVDRPQPAAGDEIMAADAYRAAVTENLHKLLDPNQGFRSRVAAISLELSQAGGVPEAVKIVLNVAAGTWRDTGKGQEL